MIFEWDDANDPQGNIKHIARHNLTPSDVEAVIMNPVGRGHSRSSGLPICFGNTPDGRFIIVVYRITSSNPPAIYPITAYDVPQPGKRK